MCSGDMQQLQNHNWHRRLSTAARTRLRDVERRSIPVSFTWRGLKQAPVSEARSRDSLKLHTYIRNCSHYMSRGREAAVKSFFIHTSGNVAGSIIRSSQQAQNLFTHTHSQLQLLRVPGTCSRSMSHCLISSCHTISHRSNLSVSCGRTFKVVL